MEPLGNPFGKGDVNRLVEKKNEINSKLQALVAEETVLKSGRKALENKPNGNCCVIS